MKKREDATRDILNVRLKEDYYILYHQYSRLVELDCNSSQLFLYFGQNKRLPECLVNMATL